MGRVHAEIPRHELVNEIESIIHHRSALESLVEGARASLARTGSLPNNEIWNYLTWRRDLDPSRFDHYHPEFVSVFRREEHLLKSRQEFHSLSPTLPQSLDSIPTISVSTLTQGSPVTGTPVVPPNVNPTSRGSGSVPEPSSIILIAGAVLVGMVGFVFERRRDWICVNVQ